MTEFEKVKYVRQCCFSILPQLYCDRFTIEEQIAKIVLELNKLINNNNKLEDYIKEIIKEVIDNGEIEVIIRDILTNYMLNVKFPPNGLTPAKGDGTADDTNAIQGCIDYAYAHNGMSVYFPSGAYLVNVLNLRPSTCLFGFDRYTTKLVLRGGVNSSMLAGNIDTLTLSNLSLDGNMDIQVNNVNLIDISVKTAILTNLLLTDGYDILKVNVKENLQLSNIIFKHAVTHSLVLDGEGYTQGDNLIFESLSELVGKSYVVINNNNNIFEKMKFVGGSPKTVELNGNNNVVKYWDNENIISYVDTGINNNVEIYGKKIIEKITQEKTVTVGETLTNEAKNIVQSAKNSHTNTSKSYLQNVETNYTENVQGEKTSNLNNFSEIVEGKKESTSTQFTENILTKYIQNIVEKGLINADDYHLNIANHLTYESPQVFDPRFNSVKMKTPAGTIYDVLVAKPGKSYETYLINVRDYGAKGDGVTDDRPAFINFLNDAMDKDCVAYIPAGNYLISDVLSINKAITLYGDGLKTNLIFEKDGFNISTTTQPKGCTMYNLNICSKSTLYTGVYLKGYWHNLSRITFQGYGAMDYDPSYYWNTSLRLDGVWYSTIRDCIFINGPLHTVDTFYFRGVAIRAYGQTVNVFITTCTFNNFNFIAIFDNTTEGIKYTNNLSVNTKSGINDSGYLNNIVDNLIDMCVDYGIILRGNGTIVNNNFIALHYYEPHKNNTAFIPIEAVGTGFTITNNYIQGGEIQPINGLIVNGDYQNISNNYINAFRTSINLTGNNGVILGNRCRYAATNDIVVTGNFNKINDNTLSNNKLIINGGNNQSQIDYLTYINNFPTNGEATKTFDVPVTAYTVKPTMVTFSFTAGKIGGYYDYGNSTPTNLKVVLFPTTGSTLPVLTTNNVGLNIIR